MLPTKQLKPMIAFATLASCHRASVPPSITIDNAWARATLPGQASSTAYFTIRDKGGADRLLSVSSDAANASLHSTSMEGGVMRMRPLPSLEIHANSTVRFEPGGNHVMLIGLKSPLKPGSAIPLDLKFQKSGVHHVDSAVRAVTGDAM